MLLEGLKTAAAINHNPGNSEGVMWPFRRRRTGEEVYLDDLSKLPEPSPVIKYVNLLLMDLAERADSVFTLQSDEPLPALSPGWAKGVEVIPTYSEVVGRLTKLTRSHHTDSVQARGGRIEIFVGKVGAVNMHVGISNDGQTVTISVERLGKNASLPVRSR